MLSVLRRSCSNQQRLLTRSFAEIVPVVSGLDSRPSPPPPLKGTIDPPPARAIAGPDGSQPASDAEPKVVASVRLGNRIPTQVDHGLYAFFRKTEPAAGQTLKGEAQYETLGGSIEMARTRSGRSWKASELRLKSFEDLHTLWYILLRERNLLATQEEEVRRLGAMKLVQTFNNQVRMCRKSMARIKYVMNERRLAYEGAVKLADEEKTAHITNLVLEKQLAEHQKEREQLFQRQKRARIRAARDAKRKAAQANKEAQVASVQSDVNKQDAVVVQVASDVDEKGTLVAQVTSPSSDVNVPDAVAIQPESVEALGDAPPPTTAPQPEKPKPKVIPKARSSESASEAATAGLFGTRGRRR